MARTRKRSRYSHDDVLFEIGTMRDHLDLQDKDIYLGIGMTQSAFSRKMTGVRRFTVEEIGDIADFFAGVTGRVLPGWPFLSSKECAYIEENLPGLGRAVPRSKPHRP
jgi:hypothetical protein